MGITRRERKPKKKPVRDKVKETLDILTKLILDLGFTQLYKDVFVIMYQRQNKILRIDRFDCSIEYLVDCKLRYKGDKYTNIEELIK